MKKFLAGNLRVDCSTEEAAELSDIILSFVPRNMYPSEYRGEHVKPEDFVLRAYRDSYTAPVIEGNKLNAVKNPYTAITWWPARTISFKEFKKCQTQ